MNNRLTKTTFIPLYNINLTSQERKAELSKIKLSEEDISLGITKEEILNIRLKEAENEENWYLFQIRKNNGIEKINRQRGIMKQNG